MTELERRINELTSTLSPSGIVGKTLSEVKKGLNSSSNIADAVADFGENLQDNIEDEIGGITGAIGGWVAGKTTKVVGRVGGGLVAGTLKTVAAIIPDASDLKMPESDKKIAHCIDTYTIPTDKKELFELLQYLSVTLRSADLPYGKQAVESFKALQQRVYSTLLVVAEGDQTLLKLSKPYAPKKRFGLF